MPATGQYEFTDREKFVLSYYRSGELSKSGLMRHLVYLIIVVGASVACLVLAAVKEDLPLGFVAYLIVLGWLLKQGSEGRKWSRDFESIFRKYDAKLKALTDAQNKV